MEESLKYSARSKKDKKERGNRKMEGKQKRIEKKGEKIEEKKGKKSLKYSVREKRKIK